MTEPYRPKLDWLQQLPPKDRQAAQDDDNRRQDAQGLTQEIVDTVLPSGGRGFQWAFYQHGMRIPNGIQGLAGL